MLAPGTDSDTGANANRLEHQPTALNADFWDEGNVLFDDSIYTDIQ